MEYFQVDVKGERRGEWSLSDLPDVPEEKATISRGETLFNVAIITIVFIFILLFPDVPKAHINNLDGSVTTISFFNPAYIKTFQWMIILTFLSSLVSGIIQLIVGRWTLRLSMICSVLETVSGVFFMLFFVNPKVWNPALLDEQVLWGWFYNQSKEQVSLIIASIIGLITVIEVGYILYKGIQRINVIKRKI